MSLQSENYFSLFGIEPAYEVDVAALSERYRKLQQEAHPDRFAHAGQQEQLRAVQQTSYINEAYETLKSATARARYLLMLLGKALDDTDTRMPGDFLMEQMALREELELIHDKGDPLTELDALRSRVELLEGEERERVSVAFSLADEQALEQAQVSVKKMQFLNKLLDEITEREEELVEDY